MIALVLNRRYSEIKTNQYRVSDRMKKKNPSQALKPFNNTENFFYRVGKMPHNSYYPGHSHLGGEFVYSYSGVMELDLEGESIVSTPNYGIWLPPNQKHSVRNRGKVVHGSFYVPLRYCHKLPQDACSLLLSPLLRSLLDSLRDTGTLVQNEENQRLLHVLFDQLQKVRPSGSYLPKSNDPILREIMINLETHMEDNRSVAEIARELKLSERTIARHFKTELGLTFNEWRQRLKVVQAISLLRKGQTVELVSKSLGYSSPSAFIVMFKKLTGTTPSEYRV